MQLYCISNVIGLIGENGGFTAVGQHKRGVINVIELVYGSNNNINGFNNNRKNYVMHYVYTRDALEVNNSARK